VFVESKTIAVLSAQVDSNVCWEVSSGSEMSCMRLPMTGIHRASRSRIQPLLQTPHTVLTVISGLLDTATGRFAKVMRIGSLLGRSLVNPRGPQVLTATGLAVTKKADLFSQDDSSDENQKLISMKV
jgi:hypothetical protein